MQTNVFGLILVAVILALAEASFSQTIIVDDDFEAYQTDTELLEAWTPWNPVQGFHSNNGTALTIDPDNSYGGMIDGQAAEFCGQSAESGVCGEFGGGSENYPTEPGTVNRWSTPFNISPSSTHNIVLSADVGDDALSPNVRLTIGLRNSAIPANLIELGMYNSPIPGFHYRAILFPEEPEGTVGWVNYGDESIMDIPLPDGLDTQDAVGPGFHTFKAVISLDTVIFTLDLYGDGLANDSSDPQPGVGSHGVDARNAVPVGAFAGGFDDLRFGLPSHLPRSGVPGDVNAAFAAFDNISLRLVPVPEPSVASLSWALGLTVLLGRRSILFLASRN